MAYAWSPSGAASLTAETVTGCGTFQLAGVNVTRATDATASPDRGDVRSIRTLALGWACNAMVNVDVPPASVVVSPETGETLMPATSSSAFTTDTLAPLM